MGFHIPFVPQSTRPRRSLDRLRSLHLIPGQKDAPIPTPPTHTELVHLESKTGGNLKLKQKLLSRVSRLKSVRVLTVNGEVPIPPVFYFGLAILCSLVFVAIIPSVFHGATVGDSIFKGVLNQVAQTNPGIVLLGENVDIDVDEPSVTIRWSIVACGEDYTLPGSSGIHGSVCGLPSFALDVYVDGNDEPAGTYDPDLIPYNLSNGERRKIQNLVQFDSDHVLDVHNDRLYPFDTYFLSSTLRATSTNGTIPIAKLATIDFTSSFVVETTDIQSYELASSNGTQTPSRDIDMHIRRPFEARAISLLLFASGWFLTHICIGNVIMARRTRYIKPIVKLLAVNGGTVIGLPMLRDSMPDAPDLDGVVIDGIGFFPQIIISVFSVVILLLIVIARDLDRGEWAALPDYATAVSHNVRRQSKLEFTGKSPTRDLFRPPPSPTPTSTSTDIAKYDMHRMAKHIKGDFVFPPVYVEPVPKKSLASLAHRRLKTTVGSPTQSRLSKIDERPVPF